MAFELHVWGPAFGLDSIDAECLAAISTVRYILPAKQWCLVPSSDTSISPDRYRNIISYLRHQHGTSSSSSLSSGRRLADDDLTPQQAADLLAYSSYLATRGSGLIALSLYASPNAWVELTRPAYSDLLPFPLTWTIPTAIRAAAIEKAEHLGMGYLAAEAEADEAASSQYGTETTPTGFMRLKSQLGPKKTLQPEQTAAIRFRQLADDFFTTLDDLCGPKSKSEAESDKKYLLRTDGPSSLDFLAYGYLALMRVRTPYPILANTLVANSRPSMQLLHAMDANIQACPPPRLEPAPRGIPRTMALFADGVIGGVAGVGESWKRRRHGGGTKQEEGEEATTTTDPTQVLLAIGGVVTGLAAVGAALLFRSLPPFGASVHAFERPREEMRGTGLRRFGEVGAILDSLPMFAQQPSPSPSPPSQVSSSYPVRDTVYHKGNVDVAVDVAP